MYVCLFVLHDMSCTQLYCYYTLWVKKQAILLLGITLASVDWSLLCFAHLKHVTTLSYNSSRPRANVPHVRCASFISCSTSLLHVFLDLPLLLCPCWFHWRTLLVILLLGLLNVCPINVHLVLFSKICADSCFVAFHKSSLLILSDHLIPRILLRESTKAVR